MLKPIKTLLLTAGVLALSACGFHFQNGELIPQELQTLKLESSDPYSDMTLSMRRQLQINNVNLVEDKADVPVLRLNKISSKDQVVSIFKQGREAEKQLILEVEASVKLPNKDSFPISTKVSRTFLRQLPCGIIKISRKRRDLARYA